MNTECDFFFSAALTTLLSWPSGLDACWRTQRSKPPCTLLRPIRPSTKHSLMAHLTMTLVCRDDYIPKLVPSSTSAKETVSAIVWVLTQQLQKLRTNLIEMWLIMGQRINDWLTVDGGLNSDCFSYSFEVMKLLRCIVIFPQPINFSKHLKNKSHK